MLFHSMPGLKERMTIKKWLLLIIVLENEQLSTYNAVENQQFQFLCNHPNIIITPHIAGYSHEAFQEMPEILLRKLNLL